MANLLRYSLYYGLIFGLLRVAHLQILTWFGLGLTSWVFVGDKILLIGVVIWAHRVYKERYAKSLSFYEGWLIGVIIVLVAALINQSYMYLYLTYIEPDWVDNVADMRQQLMIENGAEDTQIEERITALRKGFTPSRLFTRGILIPSLWDTLVMGVLAAFTRTKPEKRQI